MAKIEWKVLGALEDNTKWRILHMKEIILYVIYTFSNNINNIYAVIYERKTSITKY